MPDGNDDEEVERLLAEATLQLPPLLQHVKSATKLARVQRNNINIPLPPGWKPAEECTGSNKDYLGTYDKHKYAPGQQWKAWRQPSQPAGNDPAAPKPPELFDCAGGSAVPHHDPTAYIDKPPLPTQEEKAAEAAARKERAAETRARFEGLSPDEAATLKAQDAAAAKEVATAKAVTDKMAALASSREAQLRGLAVRAGRRSMSYTFGVPIEEPGPEQMTTLNGRIQEIMPGAPTMTPAQAKCWLFHSVPLPVCDGTALKTEYYYVSSPLALPSPRLPRHCVVAWQAGRHARLSISEQRRV